jgi:hypothetical protein
MTTKLDVESNTKIELSEKYLLSETSFSIDNQTVNFSNDYQTLTNINELNLENLNKILISIDKMKEETGKYLQKVMETNECLGAKAKETVEEE